MTIMVRIRLMFLIFYLLLFAFSFNTFAKGEEGKDFNMKEFIFHHVGDSYQLDAFGFHIPLPVLLIQNGKLICFMSNAFQGDEEGKVVVNKKGLKFVRYHNAIYDVTKEGELVFGDNKKPINLEPLDFSITKNILVMFLSAFIIFIMFRFARSNYDSKGSPSKLASFVEPLIVFVRDDIVKANIGDKKGAKYFPFLLTMFFFIWIHNLVGLIPIFPFSSSNITGNINFTFVLASIVFITIIFSGNKNYWKHIFATPGVPKFLLLIMIPIEIVGMFAKPFSLMVRLFANIIAGHIIVLSIICLIFVFKSFYIAPVSILFSIFINLIEIFIAFLQAYIFTLLSALFIGKAVEEEH